MNSQRSRMFRSTRNVTAALCVLASLATVSEAREMRVSSFEPPQGFFSKILADWISRANAKLSDGNSFKLYPGSILGSPPAQQELVKKGVADVAFIVPTYSPGLFPLTSVVEVPGIAPTSAQGTNILNSLLEDGELAEEYADFKVIALFSTRGYRVFLRDKEAHLPSDLAGLKLRTPSPFMSELASMLGATGVSIPAPQVYENLERGVVDGALWVFDAYTTFRLYEVAPNITMTSLTASPLAILMNKKTYESLPADDRKVIDEMAGRAAADWIAGEIDGFDASNEKQLRDDAKVRFVDLTAEENAEWDKALADAPAAWIKAQSAYEVDAEGVLKKAKGMATGH